MPIDRHAVENALERNGFEKTGTTDRTVQFRSIATGQTLYFRTTIGLADYIRLVVHPECDWPALLSVPGVAVNPRKDFQHGDHMKSFPKRKNMGQSEVHFGKPLNLSSLATIPGFSAAFHRL